MARTSDETAEGSAGGWTKGIGMYRLFVGILGSIASLTFVVSASAVPPEDPPGDAPGPSNVPSGAVMFFNLAECPPGWVDLTDAEGRYLVGTPADGTVGATVGTTLTDAENRPVGEHDHAVTDAGHSHGVSDSGHNHSQGSHSHSLFGTNIVSGSSLGDGNGTPRFARTSSTSTGSSGSGGIGSSSTGVSVSSATTGVFVDDEGSVTGTNAPYLQLLVCEKL